MAKFCVADHIRMQDLERRKDRNDIMRYTEKVHTIWKVNTGDIVALQFSKNKVEETINFFIELLKISDSLALQDEEDRNAVALWGTKTVANNPNERTNVLQNYGCTPEEIHEISQRHSSSFLDT